MTNMGENGIRYGFISANDLNSDLVHDLLYSYGKNLSYEAAVEEEIARQRAVWEEECETLAVAAEELGIDCVLDDFEPDLDNFDPQIEEPTIEGTYEGVSYCSSYLGGALNFFIFRSPVVGRFDLCSPCVPGACLITSRNSDGYIGYDVPPTWRTDNEWALKESFGSD